MLRGRALPVLNSTLCILIILVCFSLFLTRGFGLYAARATGESMLPTIPSDALVVIAQKPPEVGDIVHVQGENTNYVHRLIELEGEAIATKGDNCPEPEFALLKDVSGVVVVHLPFGHFFMVTMLVVGFEVVLAAFWSMRVLREFRRQSVLLPA
jgi:signal peptidase I